MVDVFAGGEVEYVDAALGTVGCILNGDPEQGFTDDAGALGEVAECIGRGAVEGAGFDLVGHALYDKNKVMQTPMDPFSIAKNSWSPGDTREVEQERLRKEIGVEYDSYRRLYLADGHEGGSRGARSE